MDNPIYTVLPILFKIVVFFVIPLTVIRVLIDRKIAKKRKAARQAARQIEREDLAKRIAHHIKNG